MYKYITKEKIFKNKQKTRCLRQQYPLLNEPNEKVNNRYGIKSRIGTSLVAQWLRNHLTMQGTRVRAPVQEDPTCRRATKPVRHNY